MFTGWSKKRSHFKFAIIQNWYVVERWGKDHSKEKTWNDKILKYQSYQSHSAWLMLICIEKPNIRHCFIRRQDVTSSPKQIKFSHVSWTGNNEGWPQTPKVFFSYDLIIVLPPPKQLFWVSWWPLSVKWVVNPALWSGLQLTQSRPEP